MSLPFDLQTAVAIPVLFWILVVLLFLIGASLTLLWFLRTRRKIKLIITGIIVLLTFLLIASSLYLVYLTKSPIRVISAEELVSSREKGIQILQQSTVGDWEKAGIYLLDIRTRDEYALGHIKGAISLPSERAAKEKYPIEGVDMALYSKASGFNEALDVAEKIKKNGDSVKRKYKRPAGKIYVIKGGFEALKAAGLVTQTGEWD